MRPHEIESWALNIIDRVESKHPIEDFRVELKAEWIEADRAARRIAGHANAARGAPILWLIGVDEERGVVGAEHEELANWYSQVRTLFNGLAPVLTDLNIPTPNGKTVVALLFGTDRAPFVVKNVAFGTREAGPVRFEVPWRENTSIRTASRADLLRLLTPLQSLPAFEVLDGLLTATFEKRRSVSELHWGLELKLYVEPMSDDRVVIPFHKCFGSLEIPRFVPRQSFDSINLGPRNAPIRKSEHHRSKTIEVTRTEIIIDGPGMVSLNADLYTSRMSQFSHKDAFVDISLFSVKAERPVPISLSFSQTENEANEFGRWIVNIEGDS
jgi:hypothetical protein